MYTYRLMILPPFSLHLSVTFCYPLCPSHFIATWPLPALTSSVLSSEYRAELSSAAPLIAACWRTNFRVSLLVFFPFIKSNSCECMEAPCVERFPKHAICLA